MHWQQRYNEKSRVPEIRGFSSEIRYSLRFSRGRKKSKKKKRKEKKNRIDGAFNYPANFLHVMHESLWPSHWPSGNGQGAISSIGMQSGASPPLLPRPPVNHHRLPIRIHRSFVLRRCFIARSTTRSTNPPPLPSLPSYYHARAKIRRREPFPLPGFNEARPINVDS